ncbi:MAG TPA: HAMP domain-containing sensor histidine kinase [Nitrososphaeraceae archaeon]|nr:HAMP domain-containing sensor histidine kinase [Nitrososphaeraceae archaeon]
MPTEIENLNPEEGVKELTSTHVKSRILENAEEIGNDILLLAKTSNEISIVCSLGGMQIIYDNDKFFDTYKKLLDNYKKGEHNGIRWVTNIVGVKLEKDDIELIKTFLDLGMQIRHVKNLSLMNFAVSDKMLNATIEKLEGGRMVQSLLTSHDPNYVHHFYSMFEQLWDNGIEAADRIEDIKGGIEIADIEIIQNPKAAITKVWRLVKSAKQENLVLFSSIKAFQRQIQMGLLELLKEVALSNKIKIRILLPKTLEDSSNNIVNQALKELENTHPHQIDLRLVEESIPIRISISIIDRKECMIIETKDDSKDDSFHAAGSSVYSNSKAIALSYASIFESLWIQTETYEKLKAYSKMQREFINSAAHELRTPIQPILGITEILRFGGELDKQKLNESLDIILRNARRLSELADNVLSVSLIESQSLKLEKELFNLNGIIVDNIKSAKRQFLPIGTKSNLKIIYDRASETEADVYVNADKYKISQVVYNLLNNAIKFTKEGSITISVKREGGEEDNKKAIVVSVKDTGEGIDTEMLPWLFTRFATKSFAGTGLGLFVSKHIIEAHDGEIWAENNAEGKGATLSFTLTLSSNNDN